MYISLKLSVRVFNLLWNMTLLTQLTILAELTVITLLSPLIILAVISSEIFSWLRTSAKNITGEIAVVTGGANGLGKEICMQLAKKGCHVAVVDTDLEGAEETASLLQKNYNISAKAYKVDVANHDQVLQLSKFVSKDLGDTTILVNNAGVMMFSNYPQPDWREVQNMINVNLAAQFWTLEAFLPKMKELKKGHIVCIASVASFFPLPFFSQYTATKFALRGLMRTLRLELLHGKFKNIHATTVMPFFLNTNRRAVGSYCKSGFSEKYPMINSNDAAKTIVDGMLLNKKEIPLPSIFGILYRLLEMLPPSWQERVIHVKTKHITLDMIQ